MMALSKTDVFVSLNLIFKFCPSMVMVHLPIHGRYPKSRPGSDPRPVSQMKKLTAILCLTIAVLLGSVGVSESDGFDRGERAYKNGDYATAMR